MKTIAQWFKENWFFIKVALAMLALLATLVWFGTVGVTYIIR